MASYLQKWKKNVLEELDEAELDEDGDVKFEIPDISMIRLTYPSHLKNAAPVLKERWKTLFTQFHQLTHLWEVQLEDEQKDVWSVRAAHDFWCKHGTPNIHGRRPAWSDDWLPVAIEAVKTEVEELANAGPALRRAAEVADSMHIYTAMLAGCTDLTEIRETCRVIREQRFIAPVILEESSSMIKIQSQEPCLSSSSPSRPRHRHRSPAPSPSYSPPPPSLSPPAHEIVLSRSGHDDDGTVSAEAKPNPKPEVQSISKIEQEPKCRGRINSSPCPSETLGYVETFATSGYRDGDLKPKPRPRPDKPVPVPKPKPKPKPKPTSTSAFALDSSETFYWPSDQCGYVDILPSCEHSDGDDKKGKAKDEPKPVVKRRKSKYTFGAEDDQGSEKSVWPTYEYRYADEILPAPAYGGDYDAIYDEGEPKYKSNSNLKLESGYGSPMDDSLLASAWASEEPAYIDFLPTLAYGNDHNKNKHKPKRIPKHQALQQLAQASAGRSGRRPIGIIVQDSDDDDEDSSSDSSNGSNTTAKQKHDNTKQYAVAAGNASHSSSHPHRKYLSFVKEPEIIIHQDNSSTGSSSPKPRKNRDGDVGARSPPPSPLFGNPLLRFKDMNNWLENLEETAKRFRQNFGYDSDADADGETDPDYHPSLQGSPVQQQIANPLESSSSMVGGEYGEQFDREDSTSAEQRSNLVIRRVGKFENFSKP